MCVKKWLRQNRRLYNDYYYIKWPFLTVRHFLAAIESAAAVFLAAAAVTLAAAAAIAAGLLP